MKHVTQLDTNSDSVHTGPVRRQHQHTVCIYSHHKGGLYYNKTILAPLIVNKKNLIF